MLPGVMDVELQHLLLGPLPQFPWGPILLLLLVSVEVPAHRDPFHAELLVLLSLQLPELGVEPVPELPVRVQMAPLPEALQAPGLGYLQLLRSIHLLVVHLP